MKIWTTICLILTIILVVVSGSVWAEEPQNPNGIYVGFTVIINNLDGTQEIYNDVASLNLLPFSISGPSGKNFETLDIYLKATMKTSDTVNSWSFTGTQQVEFYKTPETQPKKSSTINIDDSGSSWDHEEIKTLSYVSLHYSQIEAVVQIYGEGDWSYNINAEVSVEVIFESGPSDISKATAPSVSMPFSYSDEIDNFSLKLQNSLLPLSLGQELLATNGLPTWTMHAIFPILSGIFAILTVYFYRTED